TRVAGGRVDAWARGSVLLRGQLGLTSCGARGARAGARDAGIAHTRRSLGHFGPFQAPGSGRFDADAVDAMCRGIAESNSLAVVEDLSLSPSKKQTPKKRRLT